MPMVKNFCCGLLPLKPGCFVISSLGLILGISTWAYNLGNSAAYTRGASVNLFKTRILSYLPFSNALMTTDVTRSSILARVLQAFFSWVLKDTFFKF